MFVSAVKKKKVFSETQSHLDYAVQDGQSIFFFIM